MTTPDAAGWLPMSDDAKDGEPVLVSRWPYTGKPPIHLVRWCRGPAKSTYQWRIVGHTRAKLRYQPNRYRPLPAPPQGEG